MAACSLSLIVYYIAYFAMNAISETFGRTFAMCWTLSGLREFIYSGRAAAAFAPTEGLATLPSHSRQNGAGPQRSTGARETAGCCSWNGMGDIHAVGCSCHCSTRGRNLDVAIFPCAERFACFAHLCLLTFLLHRWLLSVCCALHDAQADYLRLPAHLYLPLAAGAALRAWECLSFS